MKTLMKRIGSGLRWCAKQLSKIPNPGPGGELFIWIFGIPLYLLGMVIYHHPIWTGICVGSVYFLYKCVKMSLEENQ